MALTIPFRTEDLLRKSPVVGDSILIPCSGNYYVWLVLETGPNGLLVHRSRSGNDGDRDFGVHQITQNAWESEPKAMYVSATVETLLAAVRVALAYRPAESERVQIKLDHAAVQPSQNDMLLYFNEYNSDRLQDLMRTFPWETIIL